MVLQVAWHGAQALTSTLQHAGYVLYKALVLILSSTACACKGQVFLFAVPFNHTLSCSFNCMLEPNIGKAHQFNYPVRACAARGRAVGSVYPMAKSRDLGI